MIFVCFSVLCDLPAAKPEELTLSAYPASTGSGIFIPKVILLNYGHFFFKEVIITHEECT